MKWSRSHTPLRLVPPSRMDRHLGTLVREAMSELQWSTRLFRSLGPLPGRRVGIFRPRNSIGHRHHHHWSRTGPQTPLRQGAVGAVSLRETRCRRWQSSAEQGLRVGLTASPATSLSLPWWQWTLPVLAAVSLACFLDPAEPVRLDETPPHAKSQQEDEQDQKDPYALDSLPEHDGETDCFLCLTNRQGPCRPYWRPLEYCVKDEHEDDTVCDRYIRPFEECWSKHAGLYLLISHAVTQETQVQAMESEHPTKTASSDYEFDPVMDWSAYQEYCQGVVGGERGDAEVDSIMEATTDKLTHPSDSTEPLWKRFHRRQVEPTIVQVTAQVPLNHVPDEHPADKKCGNPLRLRSAYALDQEGHLMGYVEPSDKDDDNPEIKRLGKRLLITILPGYTKSLRIKALYANEQTTILIGTDSIPIEK